MPIGRVAALLGNLLILKLNRGGAGPFIAANGLIHVEQATVSGVAIGDQRLLRGLGDHPHAIEHLRIGCQAGIGKPQVGRDGSVARHIERIGVGAVGKLRGDQIEYAGTGHKRLLLYHRSQGAGGHLDFSG